MFCCRQGAFNNYVDIILPFFDPPPPCVDSFHTLSVDKNRHFLIPSPLILSMQLLNAPLPTLWDHPFKTLTNFHEFCLLQNQYPMQKMISVVIDIYKFGQEIFTIGIFWEYDSSQSCIKFNFAAWKHFYAACPNKTSP